MMRLSIYRPNNNIKNGSAVQFNAGWKRNGEAAVYVEAVNQTKPKPRAGSSESPFEWTDENKVTIMLGINEIGDINAFVNGWSRELKDIVHTSERNGRKTVATLVLRPPDQDGKYDNWNLTITNQADGSTRRVSSFLSPGEIFRLTRLIALTVDAEYGRKFERRRRDEEPATAEEGQRY